ncbi:MAG: fluoride efflux transporter CrcB [Nonlabens sp.]
MIKNLLLIALGGGLGSCARYAFYVLINSNGIKWVPTFAVNLLGCALLGLLMGLHENNELHPSAILILGIGFCGGFTTFSTFSFEIFQFFKQDLFWYALLYAATSVILGLAMVYIGYRCAQLLAVG